MNIQTPGQYHKFPCGCEGVLPEKGQSNLFAIWFKSRDSGRWWCRCSRIVHHSNKDAANRNHAPIDKDTPHSHIRFLMSQINCERCRKPLEWVFGPGKTPHLHHNHVTGEIYGFTHSRCNPNALEIEIENLRAEIKRLKDAK